MTYSPASSSARHSAEQYLDSTIRGASPARLRLLLLERAVQVADFLADLWRTDTELKGPNEYSLKLLDLINELLSGVTSDEGVCSQIADLYVFLAKHLVAAEPNGDADSILEIKAVLEIEAETWRMVCATELSSPSASKSNAASQGGFSLQG